MVVTDPIADFLIRLKNAAMAGHEEVRVPYSKMKAAIAQVLVDHGFLSRAEKEGRGVAKTLIVSLAKRDGRPRLNDVRRVSKPSRRVYRRAKELYPVRYGKGLMVLSTSKGIMTGEQAREARVGGEVLFEIF